MNDPSPIVAVYLTIPECEQIIAQWEKHGNLGTVVSKIRASQATKKIR